MTVQDRRTLLGAALALLAGGGATAAGVGRPQSGTTRWSDASIDRKVLEVSLALEARAGEACARLAERPGLDASVRRQLHTLADDTRARLARWTPAADAHPGLRRAAAPPLPGAAQQRVAAVHRRTLERLRTAEARAAFAPVLAGATYRAGLLRTLQVRDGAERG